MTTSGKVTRWDRLTFLTGCVCLPPIVVASVKVLYTRCVGQLHPLEYFRYCLLHYIIMHLLCIRLWLISWWFAWAQTFIYRPTLYHSLKQWTRLCYKIHFLSWLKILNNFELWHPRCVLITVYKEWYLVVINITRLNLLAAWWR